MQRFAELAGVRLAEAHGSGQAAPLAVNDAVGRAVVTHEIPRSTRIWKRSIDLAVAIPVALVTLPVLCLLVVAVKISSSGPAFFRQARIGRHGEPFTMWKLRSMHLDAEERLSVDHGLRNLHRDSGFKLPAGGDPRVTRLGRFLRKSSLDELPQLWHVLSGRMSLVGPRPVVEAELQALYGPMAGYYLALRPGVTGLWQVKGRSRVTYQERCALDVEYAKSVSPGRDLSILVRTVPAVVRAHGAH